MDLPRSPEEYEAAYGTRNLDWMRVTGTPRFDYPIDYSVAVLGVDPEDERVEFVSRWAPEAYCHTHRHLGETSILVLEGEHHIVERHPYETVHKIRQPGFFATNPPGDLHMEYGGAAGSLVYFNCKAIGGKLFDVVDANDQVIVTATVEDFTSGRLGS